MNRTDVFMRRCLELAARGRGQVGDGPMVGAVLVRGGQVIAEGWYQAWGGKHAERILIENFIKEFDGARHCEKKSDQIIESTDELYVNMEPCCHHGKTPPCTDIIIQSGIKRVIYGMIDPDPRVAGKGIERLRRAGIDVTGPVLRTECERLNRGYCSVRLNNRPWVTLHRAQTRAGAIAKQDGSPLKITSEEQDRWAHAFLRARHDAILVGVGTIVRDNPQLNTRFVRNPPHMYRLILDPNGRISLGARVVNGELAARTIVVTRRETRDERRERVKELEKRGVKILALEVRGNLFHWEDLWQQLITSAGDFHGITSILVEGGPKTWRAFRQAGFVDEEVTLVGSESN